jgi:Cyclic nucleotide-binding domain
MLYAMFSLLRGLLRVDIDAGVGDVEEAVAKKNLDYFHVPCVLIRGVVPYAAEDSFGYFNYQHRTRYPFAFLCSDISSERLEAIQCALARPGKEGVLALMELRRDVFERRSSLEPPGGLPQLDAAAVPQTGVPMATRREILDVGEWLRTTKLFASLSVSEAAVLSTFLDRLAVDDATTVVRQGDDSDDVYLIETGAAEVCVTTRTGRRISVKTLGPGDYFGEIALVTGGERTADVVATAPTTLFRLSQDAYVRYLAAMVEVESELTHTALARTHQTLRQVKAAEE